MLKKLLRNVRVPNLALKYFQLRERMQIIGHKPVQISPYENIYHCCTQKTASQWFRAVFNDVALYENTGLRVYSYAKIGLRSARFKKPLPKKTLGTHLYINYATYKALSKPKKHKTFFVLRDPRDIIVSWYFSAKNSHIRVSPIDEMRGYLEVANFVDGMKYIIDTIDDWGTFEAQRSWVQSDQQIRIFRFEELAKNDLLFLSLLFEYLEIKMPKQEVKALRDRHTFEHISGGRKQGEEDQYSHYRKGVVGDWKNYFDDEIMEHFKNKTKDLVATLGYTE